VTIVCSGKTLNGVAPQIESANKGSVTDIEFTECTASTLCSLNGKTIKTVAVSVEATLEGAESVLATFAPKSGTLFTTVTLEGVECALEGAQPISGHAKVLAPTGQRENTWQKINAITPANGELKIGSSAAELCGSALLKLSNSETWRLL